MINEKFFHEHKSELCSYEGYLPNIIRGLLGKEYIINLLDTGNYDKVLEKVEQTRSYTKQESLNELIEWVKDNPKYEGILKK